MMEREKEHTGPLCPYPCSLGGQLAALGLQLEDGLVGVRDLAGRAERKGRERERSMRARALFSLSFTLLSHTRAAPHPPTSLTRPGGGHAW